MISKGNIFYFKTLLMPHYNGKIRIGLKYINDEFHFFPNLQDGANYWFLDPNIGISIDAPTLLKELL